VPVIFNSDLPVFDALKFASRQAPNVTHVPWLTTLSPHSAFSITGTMSVLMPVPSSDTLKCQEESHVLDRFVASHYPSLRLVMASDAEPTKFVLVIHMDDVPLPSLSSAQVEELITKHEEMLSTPISRHVVFSHYMVTYTEPNGVTGTLSFDNFDAGAFALAVSVYAKYHPIHIVSQGQCLAYTYTKICQSVLQNSLNCQQPVKDSTNTAQIAKPG
jgi:hypothetical protein